MRQNKFKKGDIINNLIILDKDKIVTTNNGSKKRTLDTIDWAKIIKNFLVFNLFPFLSVFFGQLALGIEWRLALSIASLTLWSTLADTFKKWNAKT